jgi:uncharacterized repeat protein (TIGR01451 family)
MVTGLLAVVPAAGVLVAAGGAAPALASVPPITCAGGTCTATFAAPGTGQSFTVPAGVSSLSVILYGGTGSSVGPQTPGGDGAKVTATLAVSAGDLWGLDVGGAGRFSGGDGGVNGGGTSAEGAGGGGATDMSSGGSLLLVAGGGGGAGEPIFNNNSCMGSTLSPPGAFGGNADTAGGSGASSSRGTLTLDGGAGGTAGTVTAGGVGGQAGAFTGAASCPETSVFSGLDGQAGSSRKGGDAVGSASAGGGGGGGYYGGGSGGAGAVAYGTGGTTTAGSGGGGGGSSYTGGAGVSNPEVTDTGNSGQVNGGNGQVVLSYADPVNTGPAAYSMTAGQALNISAAVGLLSSTAGTSAPPGDTLTAIAPNSTTAQGGTVTVNTDGSFSYTPPASFSGSDSFGYTVTDGSDYATGTATIQVAPAAQAIIFTSTPPSPAVNGGSYTPAATGGGSGNPVTFSIDSASTTGACSLTSGVVSFATAGTCTIDADQAGGSGYADAPQATQTITIDQAPAFVLASPPTTATEGQPYSYTFTASGSPAPSYALAAGAPSWLSVNASTGTVSGTPPAGTTTFSYQVTATNPAGAVTAGPFTVNVTAASTKADIAASLSCPATLTVGGTGNCAVTVTNNGPATALSVTAAVALPASLTEVSCTSSCARHRNVFTWQQPTLTAGTTVSYTITVRATKTGKALVLAAAVSSSPDPVPYNNVALATITISH